MANVKIGIAQFAAVHLNLSESLKRLESIVEDAAQQQVQLLVVGETWLSGYPAWLDSCSDIAKWGYEPLKSVYATFYTNSIAVQSTEMEFIKKLSRQYNMVLVIGANERVEEGIGAGTVYNAVFTIAQGELTNHHRKLMPTFTEKMLYGLGDGQGLKATSTAFGKVTASICWEHWMPMTRQALHNTGEHIHVALWPTVHEMHQIASRHYSFEGRCFVLAAGLMLRAKDFPKELTMPAEFAANTEQWVLRGGSCIIGPDGKYRTEPLFEKEALITCEIDTSDVIKERMTLDTTGHYNRPDVFRFSVDTTRHS